MAASFARRRHHLADAGTLIPTALCAFHSTAIASSPPESGRDTEQKAKWVVLPPFTPPIDASALGKELAGRPYEEKSEGTTALKWVRRCCPHLPMSLVQKLFRLRQVRKDAGVLDACGGDSSDGSRWLKRVSAKDVMVVGEVIHLQRKLQSVPTKERCSSVVKRDVEFVRGLEMYKDSAIIVINKPPGMPVQGGIGIKYSMDTLAASCLKYDFPDPPRLVHRLDRDCSGILLLGRTQDSASVLHSLFREKTSGALADEIKGTHHRALQRKYLALVIGTPKHSRGLISAPLAKVIVEAGKSERITTAANSKCASQHALTEYQVITSGHGYSWLELRPLTGRKHQLRIHCAEALGTPILGDYKYGRFAHKDWIPMPITESMITHNKYSLKEKLPFGLKLNSGSVSDTLPRLHLHCKQMVLPNISVAMEQLLSSATDNDFAELEKLNFVAPMPPFMQMSWDVLNS